MNQIKEEIKKVKKLLRYPKNWCKENWGQTAKGTTCDPTNRYSVCWCLSGAIKKVKCGEETDDYLWNLAEREQKKRGERGSIMSFNDSDKTTHKDILGFLNEAIEKA